MRCPACRAEVEDDLWFCPTCNAPLHELEDIVPAGDEAPGPSAEKERVSAPEEADAGGRIFRRQLQRSWLIRVLVTVLILAVLVGAILLISRIRKGR